jgi:hypothetical protein
MWSFLAAFLTGGVLFLIAALANQRGALTVVATVLVIALAIDSVMWRWARRSHRRAVIRALFASRGCLHNRRRDPRGGR